VLKYLINQEGGKAMQTVTLRIEDSVFDKVIYFLKSLPKKEVEVIYSDSKAIPDDGFITKAANNPVKIDDEFLSREMANAR
jgi:hypothetical protein